MLATTLLFSGFAWFVLTFFVTLAGSGASHDSYVGFMSLDRNEQVYSWLYTMLPIASVAYLGLLILPVLNFIRNYRYVQAIRRHGLRKARSERIHALLRFGETRQIFAALALFGRRNAQHAIALFYELRQDFAVAVEGPGEHRGAERYRIAFLAAVARVPGVPGARTRSPT